MSRAQLVHRESLALLDRLARKVRREKRVTRATRARLAPKGRFLLLSRSRQVTASSWNLIPMERMSRSSSLLTATTFHQARKARKAHRESLARLVRKVLKVTKVKMASSDMTVQALTKSGFPKGTLERKKTSWQVLSVQRVHKAHKEFRVHRVYREKLGHKVFKVKLVHKVSKVKLVRLVQLALRVTQVISFLAMGCRL